METSSESPLEKLSPEALENLWKEAKEQERSGK
jgi:hypothetical protein